MVNDQRELIYVGKAKCLRARLLRYFRPKSRDPKAGRILAHARTLAWEVAPSEFAALLRELELIRSWRPRFNVHGQPGRWRSTYVCLGRQPAPYVYLAHRPTSSALACFGPISASWHAREAVRHINNVYQLRDCPHAQELTFADQQELFPIVRTAGCLRYEIHTCLGPCLGVCTQRDYAAQVRAAERFLTGEDVSILETLKREMAASSAELAFERAAAVRDVLHHLSWLHERLDRLRQARHEQSFIYPVRGTAGINLWYLIRNGRVAAALPQPQDGASRRAAIALLGRVYGADPAPRRPPVATELDDIFLVASWFRRYPKEKGRTIEVEQALALCQGSIK
jgi:excinuclease ABC subunit C